MKKLLGIVVLGLLIVAQSHAAEKETIVKSLLEQYDKEITNLDEEISKLEKTTEIGDVDTTSPLDQGTPVHVEPTDNIAEDFTIVGQVNDNKKPSNIKKKDTNNKQSDLLKTEKGKLESEKIKQDIQFEIDITKGREVLTEHEKTISEHSLDLDWDFDVDQGPLGTSETSDLSQFLSKKKEKKINQLELLKTQKAKLEAEKIILAVQLNKYIDKKNLEQKIIDTQTKAKKKTKTETRKTLKKALSELKKAKKKKKILKKKKKVRKKKKVVKRKLVKKKKIIKRKPVKKKKVIKRKPVKKKKKTRKKRKE